MRQSPTFKDVLKALEVPNSQRIIERARLANAAAKAAETLTARKRAYCTKTRALEHGIRTFPEDYALASVEDGGRQLGIQFRRRCALHVQACDLTDATLQWVGSQRRAIVARRRALGAVRVREAA